MRNDSSKQPKIATNLNVCKWRTLADSLEHILDIMPECSDLTFSPSGLGNQCLLKKVEV